MMMIEITIINSSSVKPAVRHLLPACFVLPITVLLPIQCSFSRLGPHVKNILTAPRACVVRIVRRAQFPIGFSRHRVDRQTAHVNLLLSRQLAAEVSWFHARHAKTSRCSSWDDVDAIDQGFQIRRITVRVIYSENRAVADNYAAARIGEGIWLRP